ncbi:unnamed protein product [Closterium sp. NIES-53]
MPDFESGQISGQKLTRPDPTRFRVSKGLAPQRAHDHRIELEPGAQPNVQRQFRLTQPELDELRKHLDYLLEKKFIRPSSSPFAAPILFTPKKDGGFRMCIDYRALNMVTVKSRYPIPHADELVDQLRTARVFSKIDLRGYHQIRVEPSDYAKTAFRTRYGSFEYTVMPFGLTKAPATFQMTMNEAFRPLLDKCVIIYLGDILVYSRDKQQHLAVFKIVVEHRLLTKGSKCEFFQDRLEFFGHVISESGVEIDPKKLDTVKAWHPSTNSTKLQSFLGFANHVRRFVPDMARLNAPLTDLLHRPHMGTRLHFTKGAITTGGTRRVTSRHFGVEKTRQQLVRYYYWPEMLTDVQRHVASYPTCQLMKSSRKRPAGQLQPIPPPEPA